MRKSLFVVLTLCLMIAASLWGCGGGGPGSPGSSGSDDTGIQIKSVTASSESQDIDVFSSPTACEGDQEKLLTHERASMTIDATRLNSTSDPTQTFDPFPASIEECTIRYKKANEDPAAPTLPSLTVYPNCTILDSETNACTLLLIDIARKQIFWDAIIGGQNLPVEYPTHYVAAYDCKYINNYGKQGDFQVEIDFWLADWLVCE